MKYIADLHIHSPFSRATSKASHLQGLACWASIKGITVIGTGDFTHPGWFSLISEQLEEAEPGFFRLTPEFTAVPDDIPEPLRPFCRPERIRFALTAEVSSIYKKNGKVRKNHNILLSPGLAEVRAVNRVLADIGNIHSDGRPILGLDSRDLLEILLEKSPGGFLIPAHIWTPWFSLFGSKSGFDSIEECFEDLTPYIFALETGLSSDPEMNRRVSALDRFTLVSNSDCHSPGKLGREANVFSTEFDFFHMRDAIEHPKGENGAQRFHATVEFYPEEGKYHCDGHRKCGVCLEPDQTSAYNGICPSCDKPLTVGVLHRVMELADRELPIFPEGSPEVFSCTPLTEILSELLGVGAASKKVAAAYGKLIGLFGSEFGLLMDAPIAEIESTATPMLAEAIRRVRSNEVIRKPGFDGEFGVIRVFQEGERAQFAGQMSMFAPLQRKKAKKRDTIASAFAKLERRESKRSEKIKGKSGLNEEQRGAVESDAPVIVVKAGPGTGKTHALVSRVTRLAGQDGVPCTVISFTNKAVDEVRERLASTLGEKAPFEVFTFHGYCLKWIREGIPLLKVAGQETRKQILSALFPGIQKKEVIDYSRTISEYFLSSHLPEVHPPPIALTYTNELEKGELIDIDGVIPAALALLKGGSGLADTMRRETGRLFVDEFQDVNGPQYALVNELANSSPVFVIGDPDQAIYGFRGADSRWFHRFGVHNGAEFHHLSKNYRSGSNIIQAAEAMIGCNSTRVAAGKMEAMSENDGHIYVQKCDNPGHEALFIADTIELLVGGTSHREIERNPVAEGTHNVSLKDIGVLFRTSRQAKSLSTLLEKRGIPFQLVDHEAFYAKGEMRKLYSALLLITGLADLEQELFLLALESGAGPLLSERIREQLFSLRDTSNSIFDLPVTCLKDKKQQDVLAGFQAVFNRYKEKLSSEGSFGELIGELVGKYNLSSEDDNVRRLLAMASGFGTSLHSFAEYLHRYGDSVIYDAEAECITLSTLHAAKGLEFNTVFIPGVEKQLLPHISKDGKGDEQQLIEEERRLFYVGITRAVNRLYLSWCSSRKGYTNKPEPRQRSMFLDEIPIELVCEHDPYLSVEKRKKSSKRQLKLFT